MYETPFQDCLHLIICGCLKIRSGNDFFYICQLFIVTRTAKMVYKRPYLGFRGRRVYTVFKTKLEARETPYNRVDRGKGV